MIFPKHKRHHHRHRSRSTSSTATKRVSWSSVEIREYDCTLGDHPLCSDQLPISLDWSHTKGIRKSLNGSSRCPERMSTYVFPRRLTYEDRLRRLYGHDIDVDDDDDDDSSIFSFLQSTDFRFAMPSATEIHRSTRRSLMDEIDYYDEEEGHAHHSPKEVIYCPHILQDDGEEDDKSKD